MSENRESKKYSPALLPVFDKIYLAIYIFWFLRVCLIWPIAKFEGFGHGRFPPIRYQFRNVCHVLQASLLAKVTKSCITLCVNRDIYNKLIAWKEHPRRKPLVLKGARQVGKTYILQHFGKEEYEDVAYFNYKEDGIILNYPFYALWLFLLR